MEMLAHVNDRNAKLGVMMAVLSKPRVEYGPHATGERRSEYGCRCKFDSLWHLGGGAIRELFNMR